MKNPPIKIVVFLVFTLFILTLLLPRSFGPETKVVFRVEKGEGSRDIAMNLEEQKLIFWGPVFRVYVYFTGASKKLQAGTYELSTAMNIPAIVYVLKNGDTLKAQITIPEGFDSEQIYQKLKDFSEVSIIELEEREGYLFPDTYIFPYGATGQEVIKIMTDNFSAKITNELLTEIEKQGKTLDEIIIMASILEREVKTKEEKALASDVLWKRFEIGMALQVDSAPETYESQGLPEKPICNPGLESIVAAVHPESNDFWYYLSKPDGETVFSKTLEEHNIAKAKYLK